MRNIGGMVLIVLGAVILLGAPAGFTYLAALGCGMNTTGCREFHFPWGEAVQVLTIPMLIGAGLVWAGLRLRNRRG